MNRPENSLRTIFGDALEIEDAQQRAAYLSRACGTDSAMHQEVEELLQAQADAGRFLPVQPAASGAFSALSAAAEAAGRDGAALNATLSEKPGDRIGRYKLLQKLGEGGCGVVYMAEQEEPVRRRVALKVIKLGMDTRQVVARFGAERQALALMDHPNIAKVFDAGATDAGRPFFVMELVRGIRITDYCNQNGLTTRERLELFIQVCQAVQHAHQKGVIHRDLKPSNILVTVNDGIAVPKVIDFGIAKATEGRLTGLTLFTAFEQFLGTPAYMSPEQAVLTSTDIDTRSDIYSLGVLLYELLTGTTPFDTKALLAAGLDELRRTIREKEPMRPSARLTTGFVTSDVRKVMPGSQNAEAAGVKSEVEKPPRRQHETRDLVRQVRGDLDWIVMKCLEKDRARRYETANGLAKDIQRHIDNEPVVARPPSRVYEFQKTVRRHKLGFAAAGMIVLAVLLGVVALVYGLHRAKTERDTERSVSYASDLTVCWQRWTSSDYASCRRLLVANKPRPGERDLRSFEWWYLWRLCRGDDLYSLGPIPGNITGLAFLPGDRLIAGADQIRTGSTDDIRPEAQGVFVWGWKSRQLLATLETPGVSDIAVSPDGHLIAVGAWNNTIQIFDGTTYGAVTNYVFTNLVTNVEFSPDGRLLAIRGEHCVYLCDVTGTAPVQILPAFENHQEKPAFSPDGRLITFMLPDGSLGLWNICERRLSGSLPNAAKARLEGEVGSGSLDSFTFRHAFSPDGKLLASGDLFGRIMVHNLETGAVRLIWEHFNTYASVAFSPDGKTLASASYDGILKLWDPSNGNELATCQGQGAAIHSIAFTPGGDYVVSGGKDGCIRVWDAHPNVPPVNPLAGIVNQPFDYSVLATQGNIMHFSVPRGCATSPNGRVLFQPFDPRPPTPSRHDTVQRFAAGVERALSVGGRFLVYRGTNGPCRIMDLELGTEIASYMPLNGETIGAISPGGQLVASSFADGRMLIREPRLANIRFMTGTHSNRVTAVEFSPAGNMLATAGCDGWLKVWDLGGLRLVAQAAMPGLTHFEGPKALAFARDGKAVACGENSGPVLVMDLEPVKPPRLMETPFPGWFARGLAFSPNGRLLAACGFTEQAALFDPSSGRLITTIGDGGFTQFELAEFTPDNRRLVLTSDGAFTFWDLQSKRNVLSVYVTGDAAIDQLRLDPSGDRLAITVLDSCQIYSAPRVE